MPAQPAEHDAGTEQALALLQEMLAHVKTHANEVMRDIAVEGILVEIEKVRRGADASQE